MSATNRGAVRVESDNYPTPAWCVRRLLEAVDLPLQLESAQAPIELPAHWYEPCAGDGAIIRAVNAYCAQHRHGLTPAWGAIELRFTCWPALGKLTRWAATGDYLQLPPFRVPPDVIITNPPFSLAFPIAQKALQDCPNGYVALLLRLNWAGSTESSGRGDWLRANPPDVYVLPNRPSFVASLKCKGAPPHLQFNGGGAECGWRVMQPIGAPRCPSCPQCGGRVQVSTTDAAEYAWFVWPPDRQRQHGRFQVLRATPEEERIAA